MKTRIMYLEFKGNNGIAGDARIGRVTILNNGKSLQYKEQKFRTLNGKGFKSNYYDVDSQEYYWISGCRKDGNDALYSNSVEIDEDVRDEYWSEIRNKPESRATSSLKTLGKNK